MPLRPNASFSLKTIAACLAVLGAIGTLAALALYGVETENKKKAAFAEMAVSLSPAKAATEDLIRKRGSAIAFEKLEQLHLPSNTKRRAFVAIPGGTLVGVDFQNEVVVVLAPTVSGQTIVWRCFMEPISEKPESCISE